MFKIVYDSIKYIELQSSFLIISAFESYLKSNAFNGYILFNNKDFVYVIGGEIFGVRKLEDIKRPWIANVYELNPKTNILFMNLKNSDQIESLKITSKTLEILLKNTLEITPYIWVEIKSNEDFYDIVYFSAQIVGIYKNSSRIQEIIKSELSDRIEINIFDFKHIFESKKTEIMKALYIKRFENIWQKYKEIVIKEYGKERLDIEFRKIQKDLSKVYPSLDPLFGIVDLDKDLNLKIQSLSESEIEGVKHLLTEFYKKSLPKKVEIIRQEIS
ncbi:MAG: hypothetical protein ABIL37_02760 [candidate division WOR-3 bacterium]